MQHSAPGCATLCPTIQGSHTTQARHCKLVQLNIETDETGGRKNPQTRSRDTEMVHPHSHADVRGELIFISCGQTYRVRSTSLPSSIHGCWPAVCSRARAFQALSWGTIHQPSRVIHSVSYAGFLGIRLCNTGCIGRTQVICLVCCLGRTSELLCGWLQVICYICVISSSRCSNVHGGAAENGK